VLLVGLLGIGLRRRGGIALLALQPERGEAVEVGQRRGRGVVILVSV